jgi:hypothetical protein
MTNQRKRTPQRKTATKPQRHAAVSMLVPGVRLTGPALEWVVSEAAALNVSHARVIEASMKALAVMLGVRK